MNQSNFKVYLLDVGLLGALAGVPPEILTRGDRLFNEYQGAFVENFVAQQLTASSMIDLFYWRSEGKICNIPLYGISCLPQLIGLTRSSHQRWKVDKNSLFRASLDKNKIVHYH
ncbi:MAG: DUF4143 domain-containing protein [Candidatus Aminicenantes bacterium]|jgi:predicted AAA+ superfamily ATPase